MKSVLLIIFLAINTVASSQNKTIYKLNNAIKSFDTTYQYIKWYMVDYPQSNRAYWCILKDTSLSLCVIEGIVTIPDSVINSWGNDDSIIPKYLEQLKVWANKNN